MMDIGVARPSAQGQAMMSTETATTSPYASAGAGPSTAQTIKATIAIAITAGTNRADT